MLKSQNKNRGKIKDKPVILVVDDQPQSIELLEAHLFMNGYEIMTAASGPEALAKFSGNKIDLVLLDVMMPGMDGFEVCRIMKREINHLPVIMVTSLGDRDSRIRGIENEVDDFLSKPFDSSELKLKIRNLLKIKALHDRVEKNCSEIKALSELKDSLTSFIVHDLRNPLTCIKGYLDILSMSNALQERELSHVQEAELNVKVMMTMISNLLDMAKMENNEMAVNAEDCVLGEIVSSATRPLLPLIKGKGIRFIDRTGAADARVRVQRDLVERVVQNLLSNAARYTPERGDIMIEVEPDEELEVTVVSVSDSGSGIPKEHRQKVFDKFSTVEAKEKRIRGSTGLGLSFCKLAVELHGGKIWVEDRNGGGSVFRFTLPLSGVKHQVAIGERVK